ncbi:putative oxidoreductase YceM [compost metagenome]
MLDLLVWLAGDEPATVGSSLRVDEKGRLLHGSGGVESRGFVGQFAMNRAAGIDLERLSLYGAGRSAEVTNLEQGFFSSVTGGEHTRSFGSWAGVLERRGFAGVIQHFLDSLDSPEECELRADRTLATHRLVEQLIKQI